MRIINRFILLALLSIAIAVPAAAQRTTVRSTDGNFLKINSDGAASMRQGGSSPDGLFVDQVISGLHSANSSTVPLAALATTTGTFFDMSQYSGATVSVFADADGTLKVDSSFDGVNADFTTKISISSGALFFGGGTPSSRFIRIRYENGSVAQTKFSLVVIPKTAPISSIFLLLNSKLTDFNRSQVVRAVIAGKDIQTGEYVAVGVEEDRLRIVASPPGTPVGSTTVLEEITGTQSGSTDELFIIPSGSTVTLQRLSGGAEVSTSGGKVEIFFDQACTDVTLFLIETIYSSGSSENFILGDTFLGDGTACVRLRRTNNGGGSIDMFAKWVGYTTP